jgi:putative oxidoreductase
MIATNAPAAVIIIRLGVGAVSLSEGIQKFLFPADLGAGRFAKIGIPSPEFFGPFVGTFEICCGLLVLLGLFTRLAAIPVLVIMSVAIITTKIAAMPEKGFWVTAHETKIAAMPEKGFWVTAHDGRTDYLMLLGVIFLLIVGGGM